MESKIKSVLGSIGIPKNDVYVYLDLCKSGSSTALTISKRTAIHRSNVYDALRDLMKRGFVHKTLKDGTSFYSAVPFECLLNFLKEKEGELKDAIKEEKLFSNNNPKESFSVSEGLFAVRDIFHQILNMRESILMYGFSEKIAEILGESCLRDFEKTRVRRKIPLFIITTALNPERKRRLKERPYTKIREMETNFDSCCLKVICGNFVGIAFFGDNIYSVSLNTPNISNYYNDEFNALWKLTKKSRKK